MAEKEVLKFYRAPFFPLSRKKNKNFLYTAIVGFGSNQGSSITIFKKVIRKWQDDTRVRVYKTSPILVNPPFGYEHQPPFYNAVALVQTSLSPMNFLKFLLHTEKIFKRVRSFKNAPRTLDLDIIIFDTIKYNSKKLQIPHPKWQERISVLAPLAMMDRI